MSLFAPPVPAQTPAGLRLLASILSNPIEMSAEMARTTLDVLTRTILPDTLEEDPADAAISIRHFVDGAGAVSLVDLLALPAWIPGLRRLRAFRATRAVAARSRRIVARR